jgi:putative nucleotidyltransferase with HDIG domain
MTTAPAAVAGFTYNRVIIALVAVMLVTLSLIDYTILKQQRQSIMREVTERAAMELEQAATFMTEPLLKYQFANIEEFIQQWSENNHEVLRFQAVTPAGHLLTQFQRPATTTHRLNLEKRIDFGGRHLLTLYLEKDFSAAEEILAQLRNRLLLASLYISAALGLTLWFVFRFLAIRPLEQEVTRRRRAEVKLAEANRLLEERVRARTREIRTLLDQEIYLREIMGTVADINGLLITSPDLETLLRESCARFIRHGHYEFCWIGILGKDAITTTYSSDATGTALEAPPYELYNSASSFYQSPSARCLRENATVLVERDHYPDAATPWRDQTAIAGFQQAIALPLRGGRSSAPLAAISVYTWRKEGFESEEIAMLEELAGDLGFAIASFRHREEVARLTAERTANYEETIFTFVGMIEQRDTYTAGHTERVARYCQKIARGMGLADQEINQLFKAAILHDIGKIATPDAVLLKPGKLAPLDHDLIKLHAFAGYEMLSNIEMYKDLADIILHHHERHDGTGYPDRLQGEAIPLLSRILAVADAFDAMTTNRIYKARKDIPAALAELQTYSGTQFDPGVVAVAVMVLAGVTVPESITQTPRTDLEKKRFSYFFNDRLTGLYNEDYLKIVLQDNQQQYEYKCLHILHLQDVSAYNRQQGWEKGNLIFQRFAGELQAHFADTLLFRIYGNDFVIISKEHRQINGEELASFASLVGTGITISVHHVDLAIEKKYSIDKLERIELLSNSN